MTDTLYLASVVGWVLWKTLCRFLERALYMSSVTIAHYVLYKIIYIL